MSSQMNLILPSGAFAVNFPLLFFSFSSRLWSRKEETVMGFYRYVNCGCNTIYSVVMANCVRQIQHSIEIMCKPLQLSRNKQKILKLSSSWRCMHAIELNWIGKPMRPYHISDLNDHFSFELISTHLSLYKHVCRESNKSTVTNVLASINFY